MSYQRAIEDVYWRHRIWPKERPDPKPSLDAVMSEAQLEKKVADYLRNSQALGDYWQRPITAKQLQAEMDRMAKNTKQPEVLHELFEALGNDPFVIAECFARPALAERLVTNWYAYDQRFHGGLRQRAEADLQAHPTVEQMKQMGGKYTEVEFVESQDGEREEHGHHERWVRLGSHEWDETMQKLAATFNASHSLRAAVAPHQLSALTSTHSAGPGAKYKAPLKQLSPVQEDETRYYAIAVLSNIDHHLKLATGSWLKEPFESWRARSESQVPAVIAAPNANYMLPAINDGSECIVDTWTITSGPPDGRYAHTAVWTGSEMIVWGGFTYCCSTFNTGGRYNPSTDNWTITSTTNAPSARSNHTAVWTGSEMIVWGGSDFGINYFNTGSRYDPGNDSWTPTNTADAPTGRNLHTAVWTGSEMIVWGGYDGSNALNSGGRYNPDTDNWTATSTTNAPSARSGHTAIWSGSEMIVWGGYDPQGNTGGRYNPNTNSWGSTSTINAPDGRWNHTTVWTGNEMIVWGGDAGSVPFNTGGKYNPGTNSWTTTTTTNAPDGRSYHTAVWTGSEMIVWGGSGVGDSNTGGRYNPNTNSWTATSTTGAATGRVSHTAVWAGSEMIVWGGIGLGSRYPNSGGRYNPVTNTWTPTGSTPNPRRYHTAVWTGTEMIVWGGALQDGGNPYSSTGGRYNSTTDSWAATSTANAPSVRAYHTAVWTGSEMIIWVALILMTSS